MRAWSKYVHCIQIDSVFWVQNSASEPKHWHHVKHSTPIDTPPSSQLLRLAHGITARGTQGSVYLGRKKQTQFTFLLAQDVNIAFMHISLARILLSPALLHKEKKNSLLNIDHDKTQSSTSLINKSTHIFTENCIITANTLAVKGKCLNYRQIQRQTKREVENDGTRKWNTSIYANKTQVCPHQFDFLSRTMHHSVVSLRVKGIKSCLAFL